MSPPFHSVDSSIVNLINRNFYTTQMYTLPEDTLLEVACGIVCSARADSKIWGWE